MQGDRGMRAAGRLAGVVLAAGLGVGYSGAWSQQTTTTNYQYDAQGNLTRITDPRGLVTNQTYDALNRVKQVQQPPAAPGGTRPLIATAYDGQDQVKSVTDPRSLVTNYTVDGLGNVTQLQSPDTGTTQNTFDAAGNLKTSTDARGKVSTYSYDAMNRVTGISYSSGTPTSYAYDGGSSPQANDLGHLTTITDESGTTRLNYDPFGRVVMKTQVVSGSQPLVTQYAYGTSGSVTGKLMSMTYPSGMVASYGYDAAGRISQIALTIPSGGGSSTTSTLLSNVAYQAIGPVQSWVWGNATAYGRTYDLDGRLTSYPLGSTGGTVTPKALLRTVAYDPSSRITGYSHLDAAGSSSSANAVAANQSFGYDDLDRLTNYQTSTTNQSYSYDLTGNRTQLNLAGNSYSNTVDAASNRLLATAGPTPSKTNTYDGAGNLTGDGTTGYGYSDRGRMASATQTGSTASYLYNGLGQRVQKSGAAVTGGSNRYAYDESGRLLGEYDASGNAIEETIFLGDVPVAVIAPTASRAATSTRTNVALASNGAVASASSVYNGPYGVKPVAAINDGVRNAPNWGSTGSGGGWNDATINSFPDWVQIDFAAARSINEIDVFTCDGNCNSSAIPDLTTTFTQSGIVNFVVQYWSGSAWVTVQNGSVTGNNKVWRQLSFSSVTTTKIRVTVNNALESSPGAGDQFSRIVELEAWSDGVAPLLVNAALATNGGVASASSTYNGPYGVHPITAINDGVLNAPNWGSAGPGGGWNDATVNSFPDWVQIDFPAAKPISEIDVFTCDSNCNSAATPDLTTTFTQSGITDFVVQSWNGSSWVTVPNGAVTGNNKIWRQFTFPAVTTSKVRVTVNNALESSPGAGDQFSRITELEAWGPSSTTSASSYAATYVYADQINTPRVLIRPQDNQMVWRWDAADPFGATATTEDPSSLGAFTYNQRFPGQLYDKETGTHYNYFRNYDPNVGKYLQSDFIGLRGGLDTYAFVDENPNSRKDPYGLRDVDVYIWRAELPTFNNGITVGHVMITEANSTQVILSQFPSNGSMRGPNETRSFARTMIAEGRSPSEVWRVNIPDDNAFDTAAARERNLEFWSWSSSDDTTQCSIAASRSLQAGGVKIRTLTSGTLMPGFFGNALQSSPGIGTLLP